MTPLNLEPNRRKGGYRYYIAKDGDLVGAVGYEIFKPTPTQIEQAARRAKDQYVPDKKYPLWFVSLIVAVVIGAAWLLILLWESGQ